MTRDEILQWVIKVLRELLPDPTTDLGEDSDPIRQMGLDSADGIDFACSVSAKLGIEIPDDVNPLVDDLKKRSRRVGEVADLLYAMSLEGKVGHGG